VFFILYHEKIQKNKVLIYFVDNILITVLYYIWNVLYLMFKIKKLYDRFENEEGVL